MNKFNNNNNNNNNKNDGLLAFWFPCVLSAKIGKNKYDVELTGKIVYLYYISYFQIFVIRKTSIPSTTEFDLNMKDAIEAVVDGKLSIHAASMRFNVSESTLKRRVPMLGTRRGAAVLSEEEEKTIVKMLIDRKQDGRPLSLVELYSEVKSMIDANPR